MSIKNFFPKLISSLLIILKNKLTALVCTGFVVGIILAQHQTQLRLRQANTPSSKHNGIAGTTFSNGFSASRAPASITDAKTEARSADISGQSLQNPNSGKVFQTRKGIYNQVFETTISVLSYAATEIEGTRLPAYHIRVKANIATLQNIDNSVMLAWNLPAESTVISGSYNQEMSAQDFQQIVISNNGVAEVEMEAIVPEGTTIDFSASTTTANHYKMRNSSSLKITAESLQSAD